MDFFAVESQMIVLFLAMTLGFAARKFHIMGDEFDAALSKLVLFIALPCMIIASVITCDNLPAPEVIESIFFYSCVTYVAIVAIALIVPYAFRLEPSKRGSYQFMMAFGNTGFIGFPVLNSIYGSQAVLYGAILNIPFNVLVFTAGIMMLSEHEGSVRTQLKESAKRLINPCLVSCFLAMAFAILGVTNTGVVGEAVDTIGQMTTPAAMLIIGSSLAKLPIITMITHFRTYIMAAFRLVIIPVCVYFILRGIIADPMLLGVLVVTSGMPVATNATLLCLQYGGDLNTIIRGTFVTTILSIFTIPFLATILL